MIYNRTYGAGEQVHWTRLLLILLTLALGLLAFASNALAHAVTEGDKGYIQEISGVNFIPFMYL